jgi:hypothetical protein
MHRKIIVSSSDRNILTLSKLHVGTFLHVNRIILLLLFFLFRLVFSNFNLLRYFNCLTPENISVNNTNIVVRMLHFIHKLLDTLSFNSSENGR